MRKGRWAPARAPDSMNRPSPPPESTTSVAGSLVSGSTAPPGRPLAAVLAIGRRLLQFALDVEAATLTVQGALVLDENVQYAWPHASGDLLYVAASNGGPGGTRNDRHFAQVVRLDPRSRALARYGTPIALSARPVHIATDDGSSHLLTAYNQPSGITVHRIAHDGAIAQCVMPAAALDTGIYGHQVRVTPRNRSVILVTRGNSAANGRAEDPGALKVMGYEDGRLHDVASIAPRGGFGFGPRHVDFHPALPWLFVSLERQNELQVFPLDANGHVGRSPAHSLTTLADPAHALHRQLAGAIHVHPSGRFVYLANRALGFTVADGKSVSIGGETSIAVYAVDAGTGLPRRIQEVDTMGGSPRTFAIDPSGRLMVVANSTPLPVLEDGRVSVTPPNLALFRIGDDGTLRFVRRYAFADAEAQMLWVGIVA